MSEAMMIALIGGVVSLCTAIIPKMIDNHFGIGQDIRDIKKDMAKTKDDITSLRQDITMNSDMIYQMLDHLATDNNTGGMKKALDKYNEYYRHTA